MSPLWRFKIQYSEFKLAGLAHMIGSVLPCLWTPATHCVFIFNSLRNIETNQALFHAAEDMPFRVHYIPFIQIYEQVVHWFQSHLVSFMV